MLTSRDNVSLGCAGLAQGGTTASKFKTSNNLHYQINGRSYFKAATDEITIAVATGTTFTALAAGEVTVFFIVIDAAGTITAKQATNQATTNVGGVASFEWPQLADVAVIGAIKVKTAGAATFTAATTAFNATNVTTTYINVGPDYGVSIAA